MRAQIGMISASYAPQPFQVLMDRIIKISLSKNLLHKVFERIECGVQKIGFVDLHGLTSQLRLLVLARYSRFT